MRILVLHNRYQLAGGEDTVVSQEVHALREAGTEVDLLEVSNDNIGGFMSRLETAVKTIYSYSARDIVARRIATFQPDVIHVHNFSQFFRLQCTTLLKLYPWCKHCIIFGYFARMHSCFETATHALNVWGARFLCPQSVTPVTVRAKLDPLR
jgi:hypothetical protein